MQRTRRGNTAVLFALTLVPVMGFSALTLDVGLQQMSNREIQVACDAGALAGAGYLDGTDNGLTAAISGAVMVSNLTQVYGGWVATSDDVQLGIHDDGLFTPVDLGSADPAQVNAVRLTADHGHPGILSQAVFGTEILEARGAATAARATGGSAESVDCFLPFAVPDCWFLEFDEDENPPPLLFTMSPAGTDNVGWGMPGGISANVVRNQLKDTCQAGPVSIGDEIAVSNGQINSGVKKLVDIINEVDPTPPNEVPPEYQADLNWPPARDGETANLPTNSSVQATHWGNTVAGVAMLVDFGVEDCADVQYNQDYAITGFVYAYVFDAHHKKPKNVWIQFDFIHDYDDGSGSDPGGLGNILGDSHPVLVD